MRRWPYILVLLFLIATGCGPKKGSPNGDIVYLLPGVGGDSGYSHLAKATEASSGCEVRTVSWGAPMPLFMFNFSNHKIHDDAEAKLAKMIADHREQFPNGRIDLIGHSAGCGVILGAMKRLPSEVRIHTVVLLAPSVSPQYDLQPALSKLDTLHIFSSSRDTFFLKWRTGHFGTYDNIKTPAAGNVGFDASALPAELREKLIQHPYEPSWNDFGNDGGHFGTLSAAFAQKIIAPLFARDVPASGLPSR